MYSRVGRMTVEGKLELMCFQVTTKYGGRKKTKLWNLNQKCILHQVFRILGSNTKISNFSNRKSFDQSWKRHRFKTFSHIDLKSKRLSHGQYKLYKQEQILVTVRKMFVIYLLDVCLWFYWIWNVSKIDKP